MIFAILAGASLYGLVGILFLFLSVSELLESGRSTPVRLTLTFVSAGLWPLTLLIMSLIVVASRRRNANLQADDLAKLKLYQPPQ